jgi:hypothetical protein
MSRPENDSTNKVSERYSEKKLHSRLSDLSTVQGLQHPTYIGRAIRTNGQVPQHIGIQRSDNERVDFDKRGQEQSTSEVSGD